MKKWNDPVVEDSFSQNWCIFAEKEAKLQRVTLMGASYIGFSSYMNTGLIRPYVQIGRYCSIGRDVNIGLGSHNYTTLSSSPFFERAYPGVGSLKLAQQTPKRRVIIGNDVWIGDKAMILSGVVIGDGAIVAAGSIVTGDVPAYAIVAGAPAKIIKKRFDDGLVAELIKSKWWQYDPSQILSLTPSNGDPREFLDNFIENLDKLKLFPISYKRILS